MKPLRRKLKNVIYDQYLWPIDFYDSGSNELNEKRLDVFIRYESDSKTEIFLYYRIRWGL